MSRDTVLDVLERTADEHRDRPALRFKRDGIWRTIDWGDYRDTVHRVARGLIASGFEAGDGLVIMGFNRPEWFIADLAAIAAGGLPAGIYTTSTPEQCAYITAHCEASIAVVESSEYLDKLLSMKADLPGLERIVLMEGEDDRPGVVTWNELQAAGGDEHEAELRRRMAAQAPDDVCTLIYTSGTTGPPKAVMLSHHNIVWVTRELTTTFTLFPDDSILSYLPLSHIAEQVISLHGAMAVGACAWFAESLERLGENLREVRPHFFFGVPRVWEKIQAGITAAGAGSSGLEKRIAAWARRKGLQWGHALQHGGRRPAFWGLANRLVYSKVRERLGLDRARYCATAAAPISLHTLEFFMSLGVPILEVYGMSECAGPATFSTPERFRLGKAGFAIRGTEIRLEADGEILMRGPHVFKGYFKDEEATRATLDDEGWIHSGDVGNLDEHGFLEITDRKKELLITSGGKNVAPQPIERKLKAAPGVASVALIGDRRPYLAALLALDPETVALVAESVGSPARDAATASVCPIFRDHLERAVGEVNAGLARYETIKRIAVLAEPFSTEGGELTPTMKLKRRVVASKYAAEIESLYAPTEP